MKILPCIFQSRSALMVQCTEWMWSTKLAEQLSIKQTDMSELYCITMHSKILNFNTLYLSEDIDNIQMITYAEQKQIPELE